jgi:hypothetical protein
MPRLCTVCVHPERDAIDAALVGRDSFRGISRRFAVSADAIERHARAHLPAALAHAQDAAEVVRGDDLLAELHRLKGDAYRIRDRASKAGDHRTALVGMRELVRIVELLCKLRGQLGEGTTINVGLLVSPEWARAVATLTAALTPYPEARAAVSQALLEAGDAGA